MATKAQVAKVDLQASGLTCSMCSNSINKALKTLDFIDKVETDIKRYTFEIFFKPGAQIDFDKIRKKVEGAGFSVSGFMATINFNNVMIKDNEPVTIDNHQLLFVNQTEQSLNGTRQVRLLDKGFVSSKEYKNKPLTQSLTEAGIYHVTL
ncbi:MAG: heavy-metal-associated domain-containing protein [Chitinophagaceae bacterium]|nr:heavy-metal-associated domain-containing protein [Chitinophagaceae bacterium]